MVRQTGSPLRAPSCLCQAPGVRDRPVPLEPKDGNTSCYRTRFWHESAVHVCSAATETDSAEAWRSLWVKMLQPAVLCVKCTHEDDKQNKGRYPMVRLTRCQEFGGQQPFSWHRPVLFSCSIHPLILQLKEVSIWITAPAAGLHRQRAHLYFPILCA